MNHECLSGEVMRLTAIILSSCVTRLASDARGGLRVRAPFAHVTSEQEGSA